MSRDSAHGIVLFIGLSATGLFVFAGLWRLVARFWAVSFTQTLEVMVASPFLAGWALAPLLWAARPQRDTGKGMARHPALLAHALIVGVGLASYTWFLLLRPLAVDGELDRVSLSLVLLTPAAQWGILGVGALLRGRGQSRTANP